VKKWELCEGGPGVVAPLDFESALKGKADGPI
jgi:hypothetical protein